MHRAALIGLAIVSFACHPAPQVRRYPFRGKVVSVDTVNKTANIANEKVEGWMEAMTMEYPIAEPSKLHPGDTITATVVVSDLNYHLENIKSP